MIEVVIDDRCGGCGCSRRTAARWLNSAAQALSWSGHSLPRWWSLALFCLHSHCIAFASSYDKRSTARPWKSRPTRAELKMLLLIPRKA